jgi:hypothetical protein
MKMTVLLDLAPCSLVEVDQRFRYLYGSTHFHFHETIRFYIPGSYHLHSHRRENLKSHAWSFSPRVIMCVCGCSSVCDQAQHNQHQRQHNDGGSAEVTAESCQNAGSCCHHVRGLLLPSSPAQYSQVQYNGELLWWFNSTKMLVVRMWTVFKLRKTSVSRDWYEGVCLLGCCAV